MFFCACSNCLGLNQTGGEALPEAELDHDVGGMTGGSTVRKDSEGF